MQIGNSRTGAPQPHDRNSSPLDPDLTKSNREGIETTSRLSAEKTEEARKLRAPARQADARQARDKFEPSRPQEDIGEDVGERIKNARAQAAGRRIENARTQAMEKRIENARNQALEHRIENARTQDGAEKHARRIKNARSQAADVPDKRIEAARIKDARLQVEQRTENARLQDTSMRQARRIENARGGLSRESVQLSGESRRLAAGELPGVGGSRESGAERAERVEALRTSNARGELNTPERARRAAGRLLGGE
jgi:hypothetical protein